MNSGVTRHADATEGATFVQAGPVVLAGIGVALVDVDLAPWTGEPFGAVAAE